MLENIFFNPIIYVLSVSFLGIPGYSIPAYEPLTFSVNVFDRLLMYEKYGELVLESDDVVP